MTHQETADAQQVALTRIQHYGRADRSAHERDLLAVSLDTRNGAHVGRKIHAALPRGYYFVAAEERCKPVYALAECPITGYIECICIDRLFPEWCSALREWLKA